MATDKHSKKIKYHEIINDIDAIKFHAERFELGQRDEIAKMCYTRIQLDKHKSTYEIFLEEEKNANTIT